LPVEAVVRGYLAGSGWAEYQQRGTVCGIPLPPGLVNASKLAAPIFTPATKAELGEHDENIDFERMSELVGHDLAARIRAVSIKLYSTAAEFALTKGIIIADTKFEFGLDTDGTLTLMDEVLTPDSSRFWPVEAYAPGSNPPSFDKQFVRDWLEQAQVGGAPWTKTAPAPALPAAVIDKTAAKYREALQRLTAA
jgi:phosphoribosylaminoimidazole-succinocarboxamide synthase